MSDWNAETAQWYADKYGEYATNRLAIDALQVGEDSVVVDVGCGTGSALRHLAARGPAGSLVGVDPIPRMLEIARERATAHPEGHRLTFLEGSAEALPVGDDFADLVLAFDSMDHWTDIPAGLKEISRVLRPPGQFALVKDGGLPKGSPALEHLARAGFEVLDEQAHREGDVAFTLWICGLQAPERQGSA